MKKVIVALIVSLFLIVPQVHALDVTFTIDTVDVSRVKAGLFHRFPKPDEYSDADWFKEIIRRYVVRQFKAGEEELAMINAIDLLVKDADSKVK